MTAADLRDFLDRYGLATLLVLAAIYFSIWHLWPWLKERQKIADAREAADEEERRQRELRLNEERRMERETFLAALNSLQANSSKLANQHDQALAAAVRQLQASQAARDKAFTEGVNQMVEQLSEQIHKSNRREN